MPISKIKTSSITADAASTNLNIDANTLFLDATNNRIGVNNTNPTVSLDVTGAAVISGTATLNTLVSSGATLTGGSINNMAVGATTPATGAFTTLTTSSTVTHNGGTANGVAFLNASKVMTTGSALTFDGSILGVSKSDTTNPSLFTVTNTSTTGSVAAAQMALRAYNGTSVIEGLILSAISNSWSYGTILANSAQVYTGLANGLALVAESSTGPIRFLVGTGASERMRIDSSGNVGIGTSSPGQKLDVVSTTNAGVAIRVNTTNAGSSTSGALIFGNDADFTLSYIQQNSTTNTTLGGGNSLNVFSKAGAMTFSTASTERVRIDSSGNLLVGTTSFPVGSTVGAAINGSLGLGTFSRASDASLLLNTNTDSPICRIYRSGVQVGSISVTSTNTAYNQSSDYRLKEAITPMQGALARVAELKPVTYKWKWDGSDGEGFIAHELASVVPSCVTGEKDAVDAEGNPQYQGIDTSFLVATLTAAIQEQQALITALTTRITALESN